MKKLFLSIAIISNLASILTASSMSHPPLRAVLHEQINPKQSFVMGCDVTVSHTTVGVFAITASRKPQLIVSYKAATSDIKNLYEYMKNVMQDLSEHGITSIESTCFAVPGAVQQKRLFLHPHLPWSTSDDPQDIDDRSKRGLKKESLEQQASLKNVQIINDFQAAAVGVQALPDSEITVLQQGTVVAKSRKLVVGAGNGLGAALLFWNESLQKYNPFDLNLSYTEYGAQTELELKYFEFLKTQTGNVAWGKVLGTAAGISTMYRFLHNYYSFAHHQPKGRYNNDPLINYENNQYLEVFANRHHSPRCKDSVDFYMTQYIRFLRNAIYAQAPRAGVYITNSVVQNNPELFNASSGFLERLIHLDGIVLDPGSKTYLENYLKEIPIYLVPNKDIQLYGAAYACIDPNVIQA